MTIRPTTPIWSPVSRNRGAGSDQLIKFGLNGCSIAVLGVLDQKHHQEGNDSRSSIDDELPRVRELEERATQRPKDNGDNAQKKGYRPPRRLGHTARKI